MNRSGWLGIIISFALLVIAATVLFLKVNIYSPQIRQNLPTLSIPSNFPTNYKECTSKTNAFNDGRGTQCVYVTYDENEITDCENLGGIKERWFSDGPGINEKGFNCQVTYINPEILIPRNYDECMNNGFYPNVEGGCTFVVRNIKITNSSDALRLLEKCIALGGKYHPKSIYPNSECYIAYDKSGKLQELNFTTIE